MLHVDVLSTMREMTRLEPEWRALWLESETSVFQSPDWLIPWWMTFHDGRELRIITVRRSRKLVAILPLYRQVRGNVHDLVFVGTGNTDHLDIIAESGSGDVVPIAIQALIDLGDEWDTLDLHELPENSLLFEAPKSSNVTLETSIQSSCPVLVFPDSPTETVGSAKMRGAVETARHRLGGLGQVCRVNANANNCTELFAHLVELHSKRWQSRGESGIFDNEQVLAFHRQVIERLCEMGLLRLFVLFVGEQKVGAYYGFSQGSASSYYISGFDPEFGALSIGSLLIAEAIDEARSEGRRAFDFLRGREPYKYRWGAVDRHNLRHRLRLCDVSD